MDTQAPKSRLKIIEYEDKRIDIRIREEIKRLTKS